MSVSPPPQQPDADAVRIAEDLAAVARIEAVERILEVVCRTTGLGFSAVARVTKSRWVALAVRDEIAFGLRPSGELELKTTICDEIRDSGELVVIDDAMTDPNFCNHPTPQKYGFRSYISVPIRLRTGRFFGTLCAIDPKPAMLKSSQAVSMFKLFADLIAMHLDAQDRVAASEAALIDERESASLREQFIAVLGHDLRNPLSAIQSGVQLLEYSLPRENAENVETLEMMQRSVRRMAGLIDNVADFARGRLGGGIAVRRAIAQNLQDVLEQVVNELHASSPSRAIEREIAMSQPVACDAGRIAQLLSNLLGNALTHGDAASAVHVRAVSDPGGLELAVTNHGETIPPAIIGRLFEPFVRGNARPGQQGLGLGLYIAAEIARAHGGTLGVTSIDGETRFTFRMPA